MCSVDLRFGESASGSTVDDSFSFLPETGAATEFLFQIHCHFRLLIIIIRCTALFLDPFYVVNLTST